MSRNALTRRLETSETPCKPHELFGISIGQRFEKNGTCNAENRGCGSASESNAEDRCQREAAVGGQHANGVANVRPHECINRSLKERLQRKAGQEIRQCSIRNFNSHPMRIESWELN